MLKTFRHFRTNFQISPVVLLSTSAPFLLILLIPNISYCSMLTRPQRPLVFPLSTHVCFFHLFHSSFLFLVFFLSLLALISIYLMTAFFHISCPFFLILSYFDFFSSKFILIAFYLVPCPFTSYLSSALPISLLLLYPFLFILPPSPSLRDEWATLHHFSTHSFPSLSSAAKKERRSSKKEEREKWRQGGN